MAWTDWFKKAKDAKAAAQDEAGNKYGNQGAGSKAYREAQAALDDENAEKKKVVASAD